MQPPLEKLSKHSFSCNYLVDYPTPPSPLGGYRIDGLIFCTSTPMHSSTHAGRHSTMKFQKYFGLLGPKTGSKDQNFNERGTPIDPRAFRPRMSSVEEWRRQRDSYALIYEAILQCKRSAGK